MKNKLKDLWANLEPQKKKVVVKSAIVGTVLVVGVAGYLLRNSAKAPVAISPVTERKELTLDSKAMEKSAYLEISKRDEQLAAMQKQLEEMKNGKKEVDGNGPVTKLAAASQVPPLPPPQALPKAPSPSAQVSYPPPPGMPQGANMPPSPPPEMELGEIGYVSAPETAVKDDRKVQRKKKGNAIYLPTSFMEATLLSGLYAPTVEAAKGNPIPVLLRIKTPAVLPNKVRANLKGCFCIAEGQGSLMDERAHLRLVSMACLSRNGQAVIDQKIKGFVVDNDGFIGLRGRVVSKMGSMIARSMVAGFFGGVGDAVKTSASTTSISPLGATQTIPTSEMVRAGIGGGLSSGFQEIQKFYMKLAEQTLPVIEVGATKGITLVISEGVNLEIKSAGGGK